MTDSFTAKSPALARLAQRAKRAADWDTYRHVMSLADTLLRNPSAELSNALYVSLLECIDFDGERGPTAWACLSPALQQGWRDIQAFWEKVRQHGKPAARQAKRPR